MQRMCTVTLCIALLACKTQDVLKISIVRNRQTDTERSAIDMPQHDPYIVYMDYTVTYHISKTDYQNEDKRDSLLTNSETFLDDAIAKKCDRILIKVEQIGISPPSETREYYVDILTKQRKHILELIKGDTITRK